MEYRRVNLDEHLPVTHGRLNFPCLLAGDSSVRLAFGFLA
jgi:hypothetical protein